MEHELAGLMDLLGEIEDRIGALEGPAEPTSDLLVGRTPEASENRTIRHTQARLARARAREMREGLDRIREQARGMADLAREAAAQNQAPAREPLRRGTGAAAQVLADCEDLSDVVATVVDAALDVVDGAGWAGICLRGRDGVLTVADPADPVVGALIAREDADGGGPVRTAVGDAGVVRVGDLTAPSDWSPWCASALAAGVSGVIVHGFRGRRLSHGAALVVYLRAGVVLDSAIERGVRILADHATIALAGMNRSESLRRAIEDRDVIGQAKGILAQRLGLNPDTAFQRLVAASQHSNIKLRTVARWLVDEAHGTSE